jgi:hypothetical protein
LTQTNWFRFLITFAIAVYILWFSGYYKAGSEVITIEPQVKTIESEIDRLSIKYSVSSSTVRRIISCEGQMYGNNIHKNYETVTAVSDGITTSTKVHWSTDFGPLQINDYYHKALMSKLGLDIENEFDSLEYGIMLLSTQGTKPWSASAKCHQL